MNAEEILNINSSNIFILILEAILLFLIFRLIRKYLPLLPKKEKVRKLIKKYTQISEILIWMIFLIHLINKLSTKYIVTQTVIIVILGSIILGFLWFFVKDYLAGIIFKTNYGIEIDDYITVNDISGRVKTLHNKYIEIESNSGDIFYINYSKLDKSTLSKHSNTEQSSIYSFNIKLLNENYSVNKINEIKKYLLTFPSVSTNRLPIVKVINTGNKFIELTISFVSLDDERNDIIMEDVREKFNDA